MPARACFQYHDRHHPRKRVIQYSRDASDEIERLPRTAPAFAGYDGRERGGIAYSAGLAAGGAPVEARVAAAFFSTMRTAMIEPS